MNPLTDKEYFIEACKHFGITLALCAKQLGRNYIGCELNPEYIKICEERLK